MRDSQYGVRPDEDDEGRYYSPSRALDELDIDDHVRLTNSELIALQEGNHVLVQTACTRDVLVEGVPDEVKG